MKIWLALMRYEGIWTALATPFDARTGDLDRAAFDRLLKHQLDGGVQGVVPCGTTGETPTLAHDEWKWVASRTLETCKGTPTGVMVGTGSNNTAHAVELTQEAAKLGATAVLSVTPYYNRPSQAGLTEHFSAIAKANPKVDIVMYHVPSRTGCSLAADTAVRLGEKFSNIIGLKDGPGDMALQRAVLEGLGPDREKKFSYLSGDDPSSFLAWALGAVGTISVASNAFPKELVQLWKTRDAAMFRKFHGFFCDLFIEPNPVPLKQALAWLKIGSEKTRSPLVAMSEENLIKFKRSFTKVTS